MCNTCGCNITPGNRPLGMAEKPKNGVTTISVLQNLLSQNNYQADLGSRRARISNHDGYGLSSGRSSGT